MGMSLKESDGVMTAWCDGCAKRVPAVVPAHITGEFRPLDTDESGVVFCRYCGEFLGEVVVG